MLASVNVALRACEQTTVAASTDPFTTMRSFRPHGCSPTRGFIAQIRPRVVSTILAVAWVAAGRRAAYVTDGRLCDSVHFAAGIALCRAAGAVISGIDGQSVHSGAGGLVVAADEQTHAALLALIGSRSASSE